MDQLEQNKIIRIGFDIDNTINDTKDFEIRMYHKWKEEIKHEGTYTGLRNPKGVEFLERFPNVNKQEYDEFMIWFFPRIIKEAPFRKNIKELFDLLQTPNIIKGYKIICDIITRRDDYYQGIYSGPMMKQDTIERFKNEKINYDRIFFNCKNKKKVMEENEIDILVDDSPMNILQVSTKYPVILCKTEYNKDMIGKNIYPVELENTEEFISCLKEILKKD